MRVAMRAEANPALDVAIALARALDLPLRVYQGLDERGPYANARHHRFILEGAVDVAAALAAKGIAYGFHLGRPGHRQPALALLADQAAIVVTEAAPVPFLGRWTAAVARRAPLWSVDASCVVPLTASGHAPDRAFRFREAHAARRAAALARPWPRLDDARPSAPTDPWPFEPLPLVPAPTDDTLAAWVAACAIDQGVAPVPGVRGGSVAGSAHWRAWRDRHLHSYPARRNDALDLEGTSRLSPWLHYGMLSAHTVAREAAAMGGAGADKFLDELLIWRDLAWHWTWHTPDPEALAALPGWARATLAEHAADPRRVLDEETLARGRTGDALWDLAQQALVRHGALHNNLRMTWAKAIVGWSADPQQALARLVHLNHRFALDGRDPASYGGLLYALGLFDRPFTPPVPVLGTVRPRPTDHHATRLSLPRLAAQVQRPRDGRRPPRVAVVGAGLAGLMAARVLHDHGAEVQVFDKARGLGGRLSRRHLAGADFDFGAPALHLDDPAAAPDLRGWCERGLIAPWRPRRARLAGDGWASAPSEAPVWVAVPCQSALARHLATDLNVQLNQRIVAVERRAEGWHLRAESGARAGPFDALLLTLPPAQTAALLEASGLPSAGPPDPVAPSLAPVWVAVAAFGHPLDLPWDWLESDGPLALAVNEDARPGRERRGALTLYADPGWSVTHLEAAAPEVMAALSAPLVARWPALAAPVASQAHRWRFGLVPGARPGTAAVSTRTGPPCQWWPENHLGLGGDAWGGGGAAGALASGRALAGRVLALPQAGCDPEVPPPRAAPETPPLRRA
jgi:hypothetical protein